MSKLTYLPKEIPSLLSTIKNKKNCLIHQWTLTDFNQDLYWESKTFIPLYQLWVNKELYSKKYTLLMFKKIMTITFLITDFTWSWVEERMFLKLKKWNASKKRKCQESNVNVAEGSFPSIISALIQYVNVNVVNQTWKEAKVEETSVPFTVILKTRTGRNKTMMNKKG